MDTLSCHSNQSSYPTGIKKNITVVGGNVLNKYAKFQLHPPYSFREEDFCLFVFFESLPFTSLRQPIKSSDLDKSLMKHGGLLN